MYRSSSPACLSACAAWLLATAAGAALAADATYCVTCKNPDATYRCSVTAGGSKPSDALKLYCVIRTAKEGHHGTCSAVKNDNCPGIEKVYSYDGPMPEDFASDPHVKKFQEKIAREQRAFEKPKSDTPDTLVELTGRAMSASRERWRNTRDALTGSEGSANHPLPQDSAPAAAASADASAPPAPSTTAANTGEHPGFARRSYRCVMSLFRNCSGEGQ